VALYLEPEVEKSARKCLNSCKFDIYAVINSVEKLTIRAVLTLVSATGYPLSSNGAETPTHLSQWRNQLEALCTKQTKTCFFLRQ
jgi:hypothetical protein